MNNTNIFAEVDQYIASLTAPEDAILQEIQQYNHSQGLPAISVSATQGKLLQVLATLTGARRILELGTLGAYSTMWMARALPENGHLLTIEYDPHHAEVARRNISKSGLGDIVEIREGRAIDILPQLIDAGTEAFDMVFIDADKPPYAEYFGLCLKLTRPGGLIICDNVIRGGKVMDADNMDEKVYGVRLLNELLSRHDGVTATILQTVGSKEHDGMALAVKHR